MLTSHPSARKAKNVYTLAKSCSYSENRHFASNRPPCCRKKCVSTSPPGVWGVVWHYPQVMPNNATMWTYFPSLKIAEFFNIASKRWCPKNATMWTYVSSLKMANFLDIAPERWWNITYFSYVLLKGMARAARNVFQYISRFSYGFLKKKRARSAENFWSFELFFSILLKNRPESVSR